MERSGARPSACLVRVVLTEDPGGQAHTRAYFCTDPRRTVAEILTAYTHRWTPAFIFTTRSRPWDSKIRKRLVAPPDGMPVPKEASRPAAER